MKKSAIYYQMKKESLEYALSCWYFNFSYFDVDVKFLAEKVRIFEDANDVKAEDRLNVRTIRKCMDERVGLLWDKFRAGRFVSYSMTSF